MSCYGSGIGNEARSELHIHLYSLNKVAMYINEQINKQKEVQAIKKRTITL